MTTSNFDKPRPGTKEAETLGCSCPIHDNHRGKGWGGDGEKYGWVVNEDCPLHAGKDADEPNGQNESRDNSLGNP